MNIQEIRKQYPQYSDLSDKDLATGLHKKFYSDLPFEDFAGRIGLKPEAPTAAPKEEVAEAPIVSPEELLTPPSAKPTTPAAPAKVKEPRPEPPPYKSRGEALDDAVNLLEEGYGMDKVTSAFSNLGISRDEIVAHGQKRKSEYFAPQKIKDVGVGAKPGEPVPPPSEMRGTDTTLYQDITGVGKRAAARGRQAIAGLLKETGVYDEDELARAIAREERRIQAAAPSISVQQGIENIAKAETFGDAAYQLAANPAATFSMLAESILMTTPVLATAFARLPAAAFGTAVGTYSGSLEYGSALAETLANNNIDPMDAQKVGQALKDPKFMEELRDRGVKRGLTIGLIDGLTAGFAGKFISPVQRQIAQGKLTGAQARNATIGAWAKETGMQVAGGGGGEAVAQKLVGEFKPADILLEAAAEGITAPIEARGALAEARRLQTLPTLPTEGVPAEAAPAAPAAPITPAAPTTEAGALYADAVTRFQRQGFRLADAERLAEEDLKESGYGSDEIEAGRREFSVSAPSGAGVGVGVAAAPSAVGAERLETTGVAAGVPAGGEVPVSPTLSGRIEPTFDARTADFVTSLEASRPNLVSQYGEDTANTIINRAVEINTEDGGVTPDLALQSATAEVTEDLSATVAGDTKTEATKTEETRATPDVSATGLQPKGKKSTGRPKVVLTPEQKAEKAAARKESQKVSIDAGRAVRRAAEVIEAPFNPEDFPDDQTLAAAQETRNAEVIEALIQAIRVANDPRFRKNKATGVRARELIDTFAPTDRVRQIAEARAKLQEPAKALTTTTNEHDPDMGKFSNAQQLLGYIKAFGTSFEKVLADRLRPLLGNIRVVHVANPEVDIADVKARGDFANALGMFYRRVIYLNANPQESGQNNETALHEALHAATINKVEKYYTDPRALTKDELVAMVQLEDIRDRAFAYYEKLAAKAEANPKFAQENARMLAKLYNLADPEGPNVFGDLKEFITYGMTQPEFQEFLMEAPGSFDPKDQKVVGLFTDFVNALRKLFKMGPQHMSALQDLILVSDRLISPAQESIAPSLQTKQNIAYHSGDLGYGTDTTLGRMTGGRSTGHFGTGVYFVSNPEYYSNLIGYENRPVQIVNLSGYNLLRPRFDYEAEILHKALGKVNSLANNDQINLNSIEAQRTIKDAAYNIYLATGMEKSEAEVSKAIVAAVKEARKLLPKYAFTRDYIDSASTRAIKKLGYEGIDVRHLPRYDNTTFGTVVYAENFTPKPVAGIGEPSLSRKASRAKQSATKVDKDLQKVQASQDAYTLTDSTGAMIQQRGIAKYLPLLNARYKDMGNDFIKKLLFTMQTGDILRWKGDEIPGLVDVDKIQQDMSGMRMSLLEASAKQADKLAAFIRKNGMQVISSTMHLARLKKVNPTEFSTLAEAQQKDPVVVHYEKLLTDPAYRAKYGAAATLTPQQTGIYQRKQKDRREDLKVVYDSWAALGKQKNGHEMYQMVRQFYKDNYLAMRTILDDQLNALPIDAAAKAKLLKSVRLMQEEAKGAPDPDYDGMTLKQMPEEYFPFKRHGDYWLRVTNGPAGREFYAFDSGTERNEFLQIRAAQLGKDPNDGTEFVAGDDIRSLREDFSTDSLMLQKMFAAIEEAKADGRFDPSKYKTEADAKAAFDRYREELKDQIYQVYLMSLPERSFRKQFLHAENVTGFSADVLRNFKQSATAYANQLAKLKYANEIRNQLQRAKDSLEGMPPLERAKLELFINEMATRANEEIDPPPQGKVVNAVNQFAFLMLLTSGATAATQMASIPIMVMPTLNQRYGPLAAGKEFLRYATFFKTMGITKRLPNGDVEFTAPSIGSSAMVRNNPVLQRAFQAALDRHVTTLTNTSVLTNRQRTPENAYESLPGVATRVTLDTMTALFNGAERMSREIAYMMTFQLEYAKTGNFDASVEKAADTVHELLGRYDNFNRPRILRNAVGKTVFQFKMYSAFITSWFMRNGYTAFTEGMGSKEGRAAMQRLTGVLVMGGLFHGLVGAPLYSTICSVIDAVLDQIEDEEEKRARLRKNPLTAENSNLRFRYDFLPKYFGHIEVTGLDGKTHRLNEVLEKGPISMLSGMNIGSRTSFDGIWFREAKPGKTTQETVQNYILENLGPGASVGLNMIGAIDDFNDGKIGRGLEKMVPAFFKGPIVATRLAEEGAETKGGAKILKQSEISDLALVGAALGFQPALLARLQEKNFAFQKEITKAETSKSKALRKLNETIFNPEKEPGDIKIAVTKIREHNKRYPAEAFLIDGDTIDRSIESYAEARGLTYRGQRMSEKLLPYVMPASRVAAPVPPKPPKETQ